MDNSKQPEAPKWLSKEAAAVWLDLAPQVKLTPAVSRLLGILATAMVDYVEITAQIRKEGRTIQHPVSGVVKTHPLTSDKKQAADTVTRLCGELKITPKSGDDEKDGSDEDFNALGD